MLLKNWGGKIKEKMVCWNIPVPKSLDEALEEAIKRDWHITKAEFIREVVRRELERLGIRLE
ncbi:MAG: ribbon-helix-helix protein, CopG family, partial [Candidatus Bathyarchaeia archaeon]